MITPTTYPTRIEQQDTDFTFRASISTMICSVLNVAGLDANAKGFGVSDLNVDNHTWVLSRLAIELDYLPAKFETFDIETWISSYNRLISTRNFILTNQSGTKFGEATSQWCMLDLKERKAVDLSSLHENYGKYVLGDLNSTIARPKKLAPLTHPTKEHTHQAAYSDIDFNRHVNALRYLDLMLDMVPFENLALSRALRVDLQYVQECYYGDNLTVRYQKEGNVTMFEILRNQTNIAVKCQIEWF